MPDFYTTEQFNTYRPRAFDALTEREQRVLSSWVEDELCAMDDERYLVVMLYFLLGLSIQRVKAISKAQYPRGIVELFRYQAKRVLDRQKPIPDKDLQDMFLEEAGAAEVILIRAGRGMSLFRNKLFPESSVLDAMEVYTQRKMQDAAQ